MGLLRNHEVLEWEEVQNIREKIKLKGISQFISKYRSHRFTAVGPYWGDEIEQMVCVKDVTYSLLLCSKEVVEGYKGGEMLLSMEYAGYMVETTPNKPFDMSLGSFVSLEQRFEERRISLEKYLHGFVKSSSLLFLTCFPNLKDCYASLERRTLKNKKGTDEGEHKAVHLSASELSYDITCSKTFPDNAITDHNRFRSFTKNIIKRRERHIEGYVKIMEDICTEKRDKKVENAILIDSMGQGMGCCCLQITIQYASLAQARRMYDCLGILAPLILRISRATPVASGYLLNTETRWDMISLSVDCRKDGERGAEYCISGDAEDRMRPEKAKITKSRFSSIDVFISSTEENISLYNDIYVPTVPSFTRRLVEAGVDEVMATHINSLFVRDPVLAYEKTRKDVADNIENVFDEFENIQSSNWRSVRLKIPSGTVPELDGWKVEFRVLEVQPTSFENAAFTIFVVLLSNAIIHYDINLYIQMSLVEKNFSEAQRLCRAPGDFLKKLSQDNTLFYYRSNISEKGAPVVERGTLEEIFKGRGRYPGLLSLVRKYVDEVFRSSDLDVYLDFISGRLEGNYMSVSEYIRKFVMGHKEYKKDSVVSKTILADLLDRIRDISRHNSPSYLRNTDSV